MCSTFYLNLRKEGKIIDRRAYKERKKKKKKTEKEKKNN
jgi:hypothetical protein